MDRDDARHWVAATARSAPPAGAARVALVAPRPPIGAAVGPPMAWWEGAGCFAVAAALDIVIGLRAFPAVLDGSLVNPDSYMRIVRLRGMLAHHGIVDVIARASEHGTLIYWSHLIDSLLLLLAAPFTPIIGMEQALHLAALAFGPLSIGLLAAAAVWAAAPLSERRWRGLVPVLVVLSPEIVSYGLPGEVHHHIPIAITSVMTAGWALRAARSSGAAGWIMGVWAAVGIWLTPESMPFALAAFGGLGLFWLLHAEERQPGDSLRAAGTSFLAVIAGAFAVDPPFAGYAAVEVDRLSLVYLVLAAIVCAAGWWLGHLDGTSCRPWRRAALGAIFAAAGFGLWLALFPAVAAGPDGLMSAADTRAYFGAIAEMQPIRTPADAIALVGGAVLASFAAALIAYRTRAPLWGFAALCGGLTVVLGLLHRRFATYPESAALAMLPVVLSVLDREFARRTREVLAGWRVITVALFLLSPLAARVANVIAANPAAAAAATANCDPRTLHAPLRPYAGQTVIADPGEAPGLLYWTGVRTVGSLYQRNVDDYLRLRAAWRSMPSATVPAAVRATGATLVLVCPSPQRSLLVADLPPDTLLDRLDAGNPAPWLVPLDIGAASGYRLYHIVETKP